MLNSVNSVPRLVKPTKHKIIFQQFVELSQLENFKPIRAFRYRINFIRKFILSTEFIK